MKEYNRRNFIKSLAVTGVGLNLADSRPFGIMSGFSSPKAELKAGIIGLDTSHSVAFTKTLNDPDKESDVAGVKVVAAYPHGSKDIESSVSRIPQYTEEMKELGIEITDSIEALLEKVDVVFLETNDGRPRLEQAIQVFEAGKPVFIDKPVAASLPDVIAIYDAAKAYNVPMFSASSLRYSEGTQEIRSGKTVGKVSGADAYSPAHLEKTHPDLFWYGIHGVELLYTVMQTGCEAVVRFQTEGTELVVGTWNDGRIGTFRGIREGKLGYGGTAFGEEGVAPIGPYAGYRPLVVQIVEFFKTGKSPVPDEETLEIYAFMQAAEESKKQNGKAVTLKSVMDKARGAAAKKSYK